MTVLYPQNGHCVGGNKEKVLRTKQLFYFYSQEQYQFIYDALLAASLTGDTAYQVGDFRRQLTALKKADGRSTETGMERQFQVLKNAISDANSSTYF